MVLLLAQAGPELVNLHPKHSKGGGSSVCPHPWPVCVHLLTLTRTHGLKLTISGMQLWLVLADDKPSSKQTVLQPQRICPGDLGALWQQLGSRYQICVS